MKTLRRLSPALFVGALVVAALACNSPGLGGPTPIAVSTEAAGELIATLTSIAPDANGEMTITITQEQMTSLVATELEKSPDIPLTNPQIGFDDGKINFAGTLNLGVEAEAQLEMEATATPEGDPDITILSAQFGFLEIPQEVLQGLSDVVEVAVAKGLDEQAGGDFTLQTLTIDDGVLTATGQVAQ